VKVSPTLMRELGLDNDDEVQDAALLAQKSASVRRATTETALASAREDVLVAQRALKNAVEEVARLQGVLADMAD
jgi:hypothetical protein